MKIGFVSQPWHTVLPPVGSLEIWTHEVGRLLAASGHDVIVVASRVDDRDVAAHEGMDYRFVDHRVDTRIARLIRPLWRAAPADRAFFTSRMHPAVYWSRAARLLADEGVDVVHVFNYSQALPILRRKIPSARLVLHMQCEWLSQLAHGMLDRRLSHADLILGCSDSITEGARGAHPSHASRCQTIPNGVDVDAFTPPRPHRASDPARVRVLFTGRVSPEKGVHVLAEAMNILVKRRVDVELVIVGDESPIPHAMAVAVARDDVAPQLAPFYSGSYLAAVRELLSPDAARRVTFAGRIPYHEVRHAYWDADIFVLPSFWEAFGMPIVEAMAAYLPVISTEAGGIAEIVEHGRTGLLVGRGDADGLADAVEQLVLDPELRRTMGEAGRERARALYSWHGVAEQFSDVVATAIDAPPRATARAPIDVASSRR